MYIVMCNVFRFAFALVVSKLHIITSKSCINTVFAIFVLRTSSALAQLYGTKATLEHHHFNHAVMILNSEVQRELTYLQKSPNKRY